MAIVKYGKSGFGLTPAAKKPEDREALLRAARRVVVSLGYDDISSDYEAARLLESHAEALRLHRATGSVAALRLEEAPLPSPSFSPVDPVPGELAVTASDVAALLEHKGLPVKLGGSK